MCLLSVSTEGSDAVAHRCACGAASSLSEELLDRAHAGWERFLSTFEGASDE